MWVVMAASSRTFPLLPVSKQTQTMAPASCGGSGDDRPPAATGARLALPLKATRRDCRQKSRSLPRQLVSFDSDVQTKRDASSLYACPSRHAPRSLASLPRYVSRVVDLYEGVCRRRVSCLERGAVNLKLKQLYLNGVEGDAVNDEEFSLSEPQTRAWTG